MPSLLGTINGHDYYPTDFDSDTYANKLYALLGDIYDHDWNKYAAHCSTSLLISVASKVFNVTNNLSSTFVSFSPGQWVMARPTGSLNNVPISRANFMVGVVTAVTGSTMTVNVLVVHGSGTYVDWYVAPIGDVLTTLTNPLPQAKGGTAQTVELNARTAIGSGDPTVLADGIFEDFTGLLQVTAAAEMVSESMIFSTSTYALKTGAPSDDASTGGIIIPNAALVYNGDNSIFNGIKHNRSDWASRPGVVGLSCALPNSRAQITNRRQEGIINASTLQFGTSGDVFEAAFMFPSGEGFTANNQGQFAIGFVSDLFTTPSWDIWVNIGAVDPIGHGAAGIGYTNTPGPMMLSVNTVDQINPHGVWVDNAGQVAPLIIQENRWYKVRMTPTSVSIYSDGAILYKIITGWSLPTFSTTTGTNLCAFLQNTSGSKKVTALIDYMYFRHPTSGR